jgi:hypothetical protein
MKVFISWSQDRSEIVANYLHEWLRYIIQSIDPWMSKKDIEAGARWNDELSKKLEEIDFGIICLTPENQKSDWILFEAGALAKTLNKSCVCPYLIGLEPGEVTSRPLSQFQAKKANKEGTLDLIYSLNRKVETPLSEKQIETTFDLFWPRLEDILNSLPSSPNDDKRYKLDSNEILMQLLEGMQRLERSIAEGVPSRPDDSARAFPTQEMRLLTYKELGRLSQPYPYNFSLGVGMTDIDILQDGDGFIVHLMAGTGGAMPRYKIPSKDKLVEVLDQFNISQNEINDAISTGNSIRCPIVCFSILQKLFEPYALRS